MSDTSGNEARAQEDAYPHVGHFLDIELAKIGWDAHSLARDSGINIDVIRSYLAGVGYMPRTHCRIIAKSLKQSSGIWINQVRDHEGPEALARHLKTFAAVRKP